MKITRIENSKHVQERVLVFLEEGDPLRITGHELLQFGLYPGMDLPPSLWYNCRRQASVRRAG